MPRQGWCRRHACAVWRTNAGGASEAKQDGRPEHELDFFDMLDAIASKERQFIPVPLDKHLLALDGSEDNTHTADSVAEEEEEEDLDFFEALEAGVEFLADEKRLRRFFVVAATSATSRKKESAEADGTGATGKSKAVCPSRPAVRANVLPSGWVIEEEEFSSGMHSKVSYVVQVDLTGIPSRAIKAIGKKECQLVRAVNEHVASQARTRSKSVFARERGPSGPSTSHRAPPPIGISRERGSSTHGGSPRFSRASHGSIGSRTSGDRTSTSHRRVDSAGSVGSRKSKASLRRSPSPSSRGSSGVVTHVLKPNLLRSLSPSGQHSRSSSNVSEPATPTPASLLG